MQLDAREMLYVQDDQNRVIIPDESGVLDSASLNTGSHYKVCGRKVTPSQTGSGRASLGILSTPSPVTPSYETPSTSGKNK